MDNTVHNYTVAGFRIVLRPDAGGYQWVATHRQRKVSSTGYHNNFSSALEEAKSFARNN